MTNYRVNKTSRVDMNAVVNFRFDGKHYQGQIGDTLASALLANGVHLMGRSFKYHRPRGVVSAASEEPNALVVFDRGNGRMSQNVRATTLEIFEGLAVKSQNRWPSLKVDMASFNNAMSMFLPAGFYNKTFMWPKSFWDKVYEPFIRNMAGLGPAPTQPDPDVYASCYRHCETLIVGAGASGIAAALAASTTGERVILVDEQVELGGALLSMPMESINNQSTWDWLKISLETLKERENVTLMSRTTAIGFYHDNYVGLVERLSDHIANADFSKTREAFYRVRAKKVILAQGGIERPLVFNGNDRPGIMLASAAQIFLHKYGVSVGKNIAIFTSHDSVYDVAFDYADADVKISAIIDMRSNIPKHLLEEAKRRQIEIIPDSVVTATKGKFRVSQIEICPNKKDITKNSRRKISCDSLLMSSGWTPSLHLFSHSKGSLKWDDSLGAYLPDQANENTICVGACNGIFDLDKVLESGDIAGGGKTKYTTRDTISRTGAAAADLPNYRKSSACKAFVDFQNDVTQKDIKLAVREGFKSIEHVKRYTTNGMATDQGKTSNLNALQIAARAIDRPVHEVGLTTYRPPFTPTTFGALGGYRSGELFDVHRKTAIDPWAEEYGAVFEPVGLWRRAWYFAKDGENMHQAVARECKATRTSVGIFDASTLGKIEVVGPDAAKFMNLMYTNPWSKLPVGGCRYGVMLREDGYIYDDGVVGRISENRFHVTTTTGGAPRVYRHMEDYLQTEFPHLKVWLTSTTEQWAVIAVNGPNARKLLTPFVEGIDLSPEAFPHMMIREGKFCGVETRLMRVSFTGELGFEINVPSHYGEMVWEKLMAEGQKYNITPYGTETMHVLRAEKGFIIVGQDTDGTVTADDAGMNWAVSKKKKDFVGKRSLARPDNIAKGRKQLVGLMTEDPNIVLEEGAQIVTDPKQAIPMDMLGHVTSSYWSEALGKSVALALVHDGRSKMGEDMYIPMQGVTYKVKLVSTIFYDPKGERIHVV